MPTPCDACPLRASAATRDFSTEELDAVKRFKIGEVEVEARTEIIRVGERSPHLFTLLRGLAFRHHTLADGRRQILNFLFPGDLIGLQASLFDESPHGVKTLTPATLCLFERSRLTRLFREAPELAYDVVWLTAEQQSFVDLNLVAVGKFRSEQRIAFLLLSYWRRMQEAGLTEGYSCAFPMTQAHIADALGLSQPYANAALGKLRADALVRLGGGKLTILDMAGLKETAVVEPAPRRNVPFI